MRLDAEEIVLNENNILRLLKRMQDDKVGQDFFSVRPPAGAARPDIAPAKS
jgi:hypothetical protein